MSARVPLSFRQSEARRIRLWPQTTPGKNEDPGGHQRIPLSMQSGIVFIDSKDVLYLEAQSNYTWIHCSGGKRILLSKTLKHCEAIFPAGFIRIHQSYLVNRESVQYFDRKRSRVVLDETIVLPVSRSRKTATLGKLCS